MFEDTANKGFILVEILIVTLIVVILTGVIFANFNSGENNLLLQRNAYKIAQDIRRAQEKTMSAQEKDCGGVNANGYGIHFNSTWIDGEGRPYYILFANCDTNKYWDITDLTLETVKMEKSIKISSLQPDNDYFSIFFNPPDPETWINNLSSGVVGEIKIYHEDDASLTKSIFVNNAGRIEIK